MRHFIIFWRAYLLFKYAAARRIFNALLCPCGLWWAAYFQYICLNNSTENGLVWLVCISRAHVDGLVQERRNSSALATELRLSFTNPAICSWYLLQYSAHDNRRNIASTANRVSIPPREGHNTRQLYNLRDNANRRLAIKCPFNDGQVHGGNCGSRLPLSTTDSLSTRWD